MFDDAGTLWYVPEESKGKILELAPSVGICVYDRQLTEPLQRHAGARRVARRRHHGRPRSRDAKKRFEAAAERLRKAAKAKPDIKVMIGSATDDLFYVSGTEPLRRPGVLQGSSA